MRCPRRSGTTMLASSFEQFLANKTRAMNKSGVHAHDWMPAALAFNDVQRVFYATFAGALQPGAHSLTSSVRTLKLFRILGPNELVMGTSAASRPRAINTRPMRGIPLRGSNVYQ